MDNRYFVRVARTMGSGKSMPLMLSARNAGMPHAPRRTQTVSGWLRRLGFVSGLPLALFFAASAISDSRAEDKFKPGDFFKGGEPKIYLFDGEPRLPFPAARPSPPANKRSKEIGAPPAPGHTGDVIISPGWLKSPPSADTTTTFPCRLRSGAECPTIVTPATPTSPPSTDTNPNTTPPLRHAGDIPITPAKPTSPP